MNLNRISLGLKLIGYGWLFGTLATVGFAGVVRAYLVLFATKEVMLQQAVEFLSIILGLIILVVNVAGRVMLIRHIPNIPKRGLKLSIACEVISWLAIVPIAFLPDHDVEFGYFWLAMSVMLANASMALVLLGFRRWVGTLSDSVQRSRGLLTAGMVMVALTTFILPPGLFFGYLGTRALAEFRLLSSNPGMIYLVFGYPLAAAGALFALLAFIFSSIGLFKVMREIGIESEVSETG